MLPLLLLLCLLPVGNAQSDLQERYSTERILPLPKYPVLAVRAGISGDFEIEMHIEKGAVKTIKLISARGTNSRGEGTNALNSQFIASIEDAVKSWHFDKKIESGAKRMTVRFRSVLCEPEDPKPGYYTYRVEGVDEWLWLIPPTRITVEYHHHLQVME